MITSVTNPRIKEARKLQRRRYRYATGRLLIEGVRLVQDALDAAVRPVAVFFAPELLGAEAAAKLPVELARDGIEIVECSAQVFASLTETVTPQGIAAVVPLPHLALPSHPTLLLILDRVREPGNAGALLRSAEAAGVDAVLFGPETVDPFNDKAMRAGMGAHFRLPLRVCHKWETVMEYVGGGHNRGAAQAATALYLADARGRVSYDAVDWTCPAALIVGGEAEGAGPAALAAAKPVYIPMLGRTESLNAAVAGAVILFEAARQRRRANESR